MSGFDPLKLELCIALTPNETSSRSLVAISKEAMAAFSDRKGIVELSDASHRLALAPHLTLYQVPLIFNDVPSAASKLAEIASKYDSIEAAPIGYNFNSHEGAMNR